MEFFDFKKKETFLAIINKLHNIKNVKIKNLNAWAKENLFEAAFG